MASGKKIISRENDFTKIFRENYFTENFTQHVLAWSNFGFKFDLCAEALTPTSHPHQGTRANALGGLTALL